MSCLLCCCKNKPQSTTAQANAQTQAVSAASAQQQNMTRVARNAIAQFNGQAPADQTMNSIVPAGQQVVLTRQQREALAANETLSNRLSAHELAPGQNVTPAFLDDVFSMLNKNNTNS